MLANRSKFGGWEAFSRNQVEFVNIFIALVWSWIKNGRQSLESFSCIKIPPIPGQLSWIVSVNAILHRNPKKGSKRKESAAAAAQLDRGKKWQSFGDLFAPRGGLVSMKGSKIGWNAFNKTKATSNKLGFVFQTLFGIHLVLESWVAISNAVFFYCTRQDFEVTWYESNTRILCKY